jgi:hypothetical protein
LFIKLTVYTVVIDCGSCLCAACVTNAAATPQSISCNLGSNTTWAAGDIVEITVPVIAGMNATTNATNTAIAVDDLGRTTNDTFPVVINLDPLAVS